MPFILEESSGSGRCGNDSESVGSDTEEGTDSVDELGLGIGVEEIINAHGNIDCYEYRAGLSDLNLAIFACSDNIVYGIIITEIVVGSADGILSKIIFRRILISLENIGLGGGDLAEISDLESERFLIPDLEDDPLFVFECIGDLRVDATVLDSMIDPGGILPVVGYIVDAVE